MAPLGCDRIWAVCLTGPLTLALHPSGSQALRHLTAWIAWCRCCYAGLIAAKATQRYHGNGSQVALFDADCWNSKGIVRAINVRYVIVAVCRIWPIFNQPLSNYKQKYISQLHITAKALYLHLIWTVPSPSLLKNPIITFRARLYVFFITF